ncbi:unnamed protein product [Caenorhabditis sp. 36 PRJEB53466]|nr:unnamed protein product [Caenorhabditis sp. 36 PRJEB53466]
MLKKNERHEDSDEDFSHVRNIGLGARANKKRRNQKKAQTKQEALKTNDGFDTIGNIKKGKKPTIFKSKVPKRAAARTGAKSMAVVRDEFDEIPDSEIQETLLERIEGLGDMFPDSLCSAVSSGVSWSKWGIRGVLNVTKNAVWIISTTSLIAFLPYIIEKERSDLEKTQVAQQRQMLLGPSAAIQNAKSS